MLTCQSFIYSLGDNVCFFPILSVHSIASAITLVCGSVISPSSFRFPKLSLFAKLTVKLYFKPFLSPSPSRIEYLPSANTRCFGPNPVCCVTTNHSSVLSNFKAEYISFVRFVASDLFCVLLKALVASTTRKTRKDDIIPKRAMAKTNSAKLIAL